MNGGTMLSVDTKTYRVSGWRVKDELCSAFIDLDTFDGVLSNHEYEKYVISVKLRVCLQKIRSSVPGGRIYIVLIVFGRLVPLLID